MGIRLPGVPPSSAFDCSTCWVPGDTPGVLYATFSGIQTGDDWDDRFPPPPNSTFMMTQNIMVSNCAWKYTGGIWICDFSPTAAVFPPFSSNLVIKCFDPEEAFGFLSIPKPQCKYSFDNDFDVPGTAHYYGGSGWVWRI